MMASRSDTAWLQRAEEHLFLSGLGDSAEQLCRANMTYGIAKIQLAQEKLGLEPRALFVGAPDATVTRNIRRWRQGFGYGGQVRWGPEMAVLDSKPNGCGMLVGALKAPPNERAVREAAEAARRASLTLDDVELQYDLGDSNHFVDGLELEQVLDENEAELPRHLFVIHSSGHEHRPGSPLGPGLYYDESQQLRDLATTVQTPWGPLCVLQGDEADRYHRFCVEVQDFNRRRRGLYGELLFGPHQEVCNVTHQGIRAPGVFHLGSYWFDEPGGLFPLTLGPDQPVYLLHPRPNFSPEVIEKLGWQARAERLEVSELLQQANILPHGGGYSYPQIERVLRVESVGERRFFWLQPPGSHPPIKIEDARALPFVYRDAVVLERLLELDLATVVARYRILFVIKD